MANLIPIGTTATGWSDVIVGTTPRALFLTTAQDDTVPPGGHTVQIAHKSAGGKYLILASGGGDMLRERGVLAAPGTYGVRRLAGSVAVGVDVEGA